MLKSYTVKVYKDSQEMHTLLMVSYTEKRGFLNMLYILVTEYQDILVNCMRHFLRELLYSYVIL